MATRQSDRRHRTQHDARSGQQVCHAFTLIELLMVLAIIGILVGILVPVISSAFKKGQEAAEFTEITNLSGALQKVKDRFGVYPPSQIILREDGGYLINNAPFIPASATGQDTAVFDEAISVQYIRRIWPQMVVNTNGLVVNYTNNGAASDINGSGNTANDPNDFYDWNGDGTLNGPWYLQGDECLVFFLGGLPTGQYLDPAGSCERPAVAYESKKYPPGSSGFSKTPHWPTQGVVAGVGRDGPFHELSSARLVDRDNDGFWELVPFRKPSLSGPYAYFSAYEGAGYRPDDLNLLNEPAPNGSAIPTTNFLVAWPISATYPAAIRRGAGTAADPYYVESPGPNPYSVGVPYPTAPPPVPPVPAGFVVRFHRPDGFQIISPGPQVGYGHGGQFPLDDLLDNRDDNDNLTNFSGGHLQDGKL